MIGKTLGVYEVVEEIGSGGMATIYKAFHARTERHVAIKVIKIEASEDKEYIKRFEREAKIVAGMQHIHILSIFDYGQHEDTTYIVMPLIESGTLKRLMKNSVLKLSETVRIISQIADALDYAHEKGILHRDIKPDNVLLDDRGNVLLSDFGIARLEEATTNITSGNIVGTPHYMSPEQGQGLSVSKQSDIYSLGAMLFEMLTGDVPYRAESQISLIMKHMQDAIPSVHEKRPDLPSEIDDVIDRALAKKPGDRFETATEMAQALFQASQTAIADEANSISISVQTANYVTPAPTKKHHHVFISYSRSDTEMMQRMKMSLDEADLSVWTDEGIEVGSPSWKQALQDAIQDADAVVCLLSPDAAQSRWVREELDFADYHEKPIFLVHIRGSEREVVMFGFSSSQRIDVRDESTYTEQITSLGKTIRSRIGLDSEMKTTPAALVRQSNRGVYYYSNRFARNILEALDDILGSSNKAEILTLAELDEYIDTMPPDNDKKEFDFSDVSAINAAFDEKYGLEAGEAIKRSIGRATLRYGLKNYASIVNVGGLAMKAMPLRAKLKVGVPAMAKIFSTYSDQKNEVIDAGDSLIYTTSPCPTCWGYRTNKPACQMGQGLLQQGLEWVSGGAKFKVEMETCIARGDDIGRHRIFKDPID